MDMTKSVTPGPTTNELRSFIKESEAHRNAMNDTKKYEGSAQDFREQLRSLAAVECHNSPAPQQAADISKAQNNNGRGMPCPQSGRGAQLDPAESLRLDQYRMSLACPHDHKKAMEQELKESLKAEIKRSNALLKMVQRDRKGVLGPMSQAHAGSATAANKGKAAVVDDVPNISSPDGFEAFKACAKELGCYDKDGEKAGPVPAHVLEIIMALEKAMAPTPEPQPVPTETALLRGLVKVLKTLLPTIVIAGNVLLGTLVLGTIAQPRVLVHVHDVATGLGLQVVVLGFLVPVAIWALAPTAGPTVVDTNADLEPNHVDRAKETLESSSTAAPESSPAKPKLTRMQQALQKAEEKRVERQLRDEANELRAEFMVEVVGVNEALSRGEIEKAQLSKSSVVERHALQKDLECNCTQQAKPHSKEDCRETHLRNQLRALHAEHREDLGRLRAILTKVEMEKARLSKSFDAEREALQTQAQEKLDEVAKEKQFRIDELSQLCAQYNDAARAYYAKSQKLEVKITKLEQDHERKCQALRYKARNAIDEVATKHQLNTNAAVQLHAESQQKHHEVVGVLMHTQNELKADMRKLEREHAGKIRAIHSDAAQKERKEKNHNDLVQRQHMSYVQSSGRELGEARQQLQQTVNTLQQTRESLSAVRNQSRILMNRLGDVEQQLVISSSRAIVLQEEAAEWKGKFTRSENVARVREQTTRDVSKMSGELYSKYVVLKDEHNALQDDLDATERHYQGWEDVDAAEVEQKAPHTTSEDQYLPGPEIQAAEENDEGHTVGDWEEVNEEDCE